jgi:hypothetical protein
MLERMKSLLNPEKNSQRRIVIITARCRKSKQSYGVRLERMSADRWEATWSFPIKDGVAKREGYAEATIEGHFDFSTKYPGCPFCQAGGLFQCDCEKLGCWDGSTERVVCPTCNKKITLGGEVTSLKAGNDR